MGALARFSEVLGDFEHVNRRGRQVEKDGTRVFEAANDRGTQLLPRAHNYLLHYARDAYEEFEGEPTVDLDAVDILTVHQAKGLEWPIVFMPVAGAGPVSRPAAPDNRRSGCWRTTSFQRQFVAATRAATPRSAVSSTSR